MVEPRQVRSNAEIPSIDVACDHASQQSVNESGTLLLVEERDIRSEQNPRI
jgi:hypothetical protein